MGRVYYAEFSLADGRIMRKGICTDPAEVPAAEPGNAIALVKAASKHVKIMHGGLDAHGKAINPRLVHAERPRDRRPPKPIPGLEVRP